MSCYFCKQIKEIKKTGSCHDFIAELKNSYVILAFGQYFKGYCILFTKDHKEHLGKLSEKRQKDLYADVIKVSNAIIKVLKPARMNYENLGNITHHIHWHIIPRYKNDPYKKQPIWVIPEKKRNINISDKKKSSRITLIKKYLNKGK
jgi:diadenosine tetraphosphate (Ap4A) HIT family hydrolase